MAALVAITFLVLAGFAEQRLLGLSRPLILTVAAAAYWFAALQSIDTSRVVGAAITAQTASRAAAIALAWASRPAALGFALSSRFGTPVALFALAQGLVAAFIGGVRVGLLLMAASYLVLRLAQVWCYKRRGGIDSTGFATAQAAIELLALIVWSVLPPATA